MTEALSFDDIFRVMAAASVGDEAARVSVPDEPALEHVPTRFALALNVLLDDSAFRMKAAERLAERLRILAEAAHEFSGGVRDIDRLFAIVAHRLATVVGDACALLLAPESGGGGAMRLAAMHMTDEKGARQGQALFSQPFLLHEHSIARRVHETGLPFLAPTFDLERVRPSTKPETFAILQAAGVHSVVIVPLRVSGQSYGILAMVRYHDTSRSYDEDDLALLRAFADHAGLAIASAHAYAAEHAARERYRLMFEGSPQPMFVTDPITLAILEANDAALLQYGYTRDEMVKLTIADFWPAEDVAGNHASLALTDLPPALIQTRHVKKDGAICEVEIRGHVLTLRGRVCRLVLVSDVTARVRAEQARRVAETRFARLAGSGVLGIIVVALAKRAVVEVNDTLLELVGYSRDELVSGEVPWADLTPREWAVVDQQALDQLEETGVASLREKQYLRKDGSRVPVLVGSAMVEGSAGECISFVLDIRESKRADAALASLRDARASEATFRTFIESAPDAVVVVNVEGQIVLVNSQTERLFGYSRNELLGRPVEILVPERLRRTYPRGTSYLTPSGSRGSGVELRARRKLGAEFPVEVTSSPLETDHGRLVSSIIRDITERKVVEEQRFHLAAIVDSSDDAIIGQSLEGTMTSWNEGAQRLFGYTAFEMIGQPVSSLMPASRRHESQEILVALAHGRATRFDTVRLCKDGREIEVSVTSSPIRSSDGRLIGGSKIVRDITARRQNEIALARAKDAAEAANRELEAFSYSVAHDLRAPLRGMNGFAQVLLDTYRDKLDADGQDWLQEIVENAGKMGALIDALLSLARVSRSELHEEHVDLTALVRAAAKHLAAETSGHHVELVVAEGVTAQLDPVLARSLIENLLGNAWKFTSKVPRARVEFGVAEWKGDRALFVRDNGAGFDMAYAEKLFGPFQRLHTVDEFPGTGIGLATVQRIVRRHGGRVWAEGLVDGGATFYFSIPDRAAASQ